MFKRRKTKLNIDFEIWDTTGLKEYRVTQKLYFKNATVCILIYDITRRTSFEELQKFWINEIKSNSPQNVSK